MIKAEVQRIEWTDEVIAISRWSTAKWIRFGCGFVFGSVVGVLEAPDIQYRLRTFGVDQVSFLPAIPIILVIALLCGVTASAGAR